VYATVLDAAPDLGGTWYWNRYPARRVSDSKLHLLLFFLEEFANDGTEGTVSGQPKTPLSQRMSADKIRACAITVQFTPPI